MSDKKKLFIIRLVIFIALLLVPPIYLVFRYDLFTKVSKLTFGGWGIMAIILLAIGIFLFLRYLVKGKQYSYWKQVLKAVLYVVVPCFAIYLIIYLSKEYLERLLELIIVFMASYFSALVVNPLPQYTYEKSKGEFESWLNYSLDNREKAKEENENSSNSNEQSV